MKNQIKKQKIIVLSKKEARTYRTSKEANIYNQIDGKVIDRWEKGRSFTSYIYSDDWIKITGYFVDKKWQKAKKDLWIRKNEAVRR